MNLGIFKGNLTRDCEQRKMGNGTAICSFTIAVNSGFGDKEHTDYVDCAIFGKRAEGKLTQYLVKGTQVIVSGDVKLAVREHDGKTYANMKLFVKDLDLIGGSQVKQNQSSNAQDHYNASQASTTKVDEFGDDIPF